MTTKTYMMRVPPQNLEAEQSVLGGILIEEQAIARVLDMLAPADFYQEQHRRIYSAMTELFKRNQPIDFITLTELLKEKNILDDAGGIPYIASLVDNVPTAANIRYYAGIVKRHANLRRLITACSEAQADAYEAKSDPHDLILKLAREIIAIETGKDATVHIHDPLKSEIDRIATKFKDKDYHPGWNTSYPSINNELGGIQKRQLFVVAARPSVGKTALLVNMVGTLSKQTPILFFCLDQTKEEFARRIIARYAMINNYAIRDGKFPKEEWLNITETVADFSQLPVFINENTHQTIDDIEFLTKKYVLEHNIGVVMIDYLQMIRRPGRKSENEEIGEITWRLKELAKELNVNVMLLSQLNRNLDKRPDPRPVLSDLRGSGSIEQDANIVVFLHHDDKYIGTDPITRKEIRGRLEFIVAKHKDGRVGKIYVKVDKPIYLMEETEAEFK